MCDISFVYNIIISPLYYGNYIFLDTYENAVNPTYAKLFIVEDFIGAFHC